jgi:hypothetical protein
MVGSKKEYLGSGNKHCNAWQLSVNGATSDPQIEFGGVSADITSIRAPDPILRRN